MFSSGTPFSNRVYENIRCNLTPQFFLIASLFHIRTASDVIVQYKIVNKSVPLTVFMHLPHSSGCVKRGFRTFIQFEKRISRTRESSHVRTALI